MNKKLLNILVCPQCQQSLNQKAQQLHCAICQLAFPIVDGIPVLLMDKAQSSVKSSD